jgi:hypothetical protein
MKQKPVQVGRPKGPIARERQINFSMTEGDAQWLTDFAESYGFKSRSEFICFCMERLIQGGFSGIAGLKLCLTLQKHCQQYNPDRWNQGSLDFGQLRPSPPIPDEFLTDRELKDEVRSIAQTLKLKGNQI